MFSPAPQSGEKGREKTNDFREKVEACHEPEVNLGWAGLLLNSSQLSFALQGPPAPKPPALYPTFSGSSGGWGRRPGEGKTVRKLTVSFSQRREWGAGQGQTVAGTGRRNKPGGLACCSQAKLRPSWAFSCLWQRQRPWAMKSRLMKRSLERTRRKWERIQITWEITSKREEEEAESYLVLTAQALSSWGESWPSQLCLKLVVWFWPSNLKSLTLSLLLFKMRIIVLAYFIRLLGGLSETTYKALNIMLGTWKLLIIIIIITISSSSFPQRITVSWALKKREWTDSEMGKKKPHFSKKEK